jgi:hypothetical protein
MTTAFSVESAALARLGNQALIRSEHSSAAAVVAALGAVQAQEFPFARWALALRMAGGVTDAELLHAFDEGQILRTHVLRPTWHFVTPADIRWMLALTAPRIHRALAGYIRRHGLDVKTLTRATAVFEKALEGGRHLTRGELRSHLARRRIVADGIRLAFLVMFAELEGVICSGPWSRGGSGGSVPTYALLDERAPRVRQLTRDESLAELARRFVSSHGPATVRDFAWWSGLAAADCRRGLDMIDARRMELDGRSYWSLAAIARKPIPGPIVRLLPVYDEYLVAYRDRDVVPFTWGMGRPQESMKVRHAVVVNGGVAGTWNTSKERGDRVLEVTLFTTLTASERRAVEKEGARYARFAGEALSMVVR